MLAIQWVAEDIPMKGCSGSLEGMMLMVAGNTIKVNGAATIQGSIPRDLGGARTLPSLAGPSTLVKGLHGPDTTQSTPMDGAMATTTTSSRKG